MSTSRVREPYELPVTEPLRVARWATTIAGTAAFIAAAFGWRYGQQRLYQADDLLLIQVYGQDIVVLVIALPLLLFSVLWARRGSARGLVAWGGVLIYLAYWYHYLLGAAEFGAMYLVHVVLVGSSLFALAALGMSLDIERLAHRFDIRARTGFIGGVLVFAGSLFALMAVSDLFQRLGNHEILGDALRGVYNVDLTVMLPATIGAGVLLWHHHPWGYALAGPLFVNAALSVLTVFTAMTGLMMAGVPVRAATTFLVAPSVVLVVLAVAWIRRVRT